MARDGRSSSSERELAAGPVQLGTVTASVTGFARCVTAEAQQHPVSTLANVGVVRDAWLFNTLDSEEGRVRMAIFAAMLIAFACREFGSDAYTFAVAYPIVHAVQLVLDAVARLGDPELSRAFCGRTYIVQVADARVGASRSLAKVDRCSWDGAPRRTSS